MTGFTDNWAGQNLVTFLFGAMFLFALVGKMLACVCSVIGHWWRGMRAVNDAPQTTEIETVTL